VEIIALLLNGYVGQITGQRVLASLGGLVASIVGMLLIVALPLSNNVGRLIGYYLTQASPTPFVALLSLISSNVAGYTKKTTVAALYLIGYCAGNIIGKQKSQKQKRSANTTKAHKPSVHRTLPAMSPLK
jgi:ACS family allantoate permease-like MFS transporter